MRKRCGKTRDEWRCWLFPWSSQKSVHGAIAHLVPLALDQRATNCHAVPIFPESGRPLVLVPSRHGQGILLEMKEPA